MAARSEAVEEDGGQPLGGAVDGRRQARRPGPDDHQVERLGADLPRQAEALGHSVDADHLPGHSRVSLQIVFRSGGDFREDNLFGGSSAQDAPDAVEQGGFAQKKLIVARKLHGVAQGGPPAPGPTRLVELFQAEVSSGLLLVLDGGVLGNVPPSTLVDCTDSVPRLVREGAIPRGELRRAAGRLAP